MLGNLNLEKDQLSCLVCGGTDKLNLCAHRNEVKIVGFIIICENCFPVIAGKQIVVDLYDNLKQAD